MEINSENLLFRHTGVKLPEATIPTFNLRGGGLKIGDSDFMGIKSHNNQSIWDLLDEFEPEEEAENNVNESQPSSPIIRRDPDSMYPNARKIFHPEVDENLNRNLTFVESNLVFNNGSDQQKVGMSKIVLFLKEMDVSREDSKLFQTLMSARFNKSEPKFKKAMSEITNLVKKSTIAGTTSEELRESVYKVFDIAKRRTRNTS